ncbi:MAG: exosome complex protein Rrp42 [Candidatus Altiarchaeota archaeon]|nr:exosome complex protein Rrp42 [Candidatus Altiarchaeota archaeon]
MIGDLTKKNIIDSVKTGVRIDGRKIDEFRPIKIETGVVTKAEGSAMVELGKSKVIVGIKMGIGEPFSDRPDQGVLMTNAELTAMSANEFEPGPPSPDAIELARVIDRAIRESKVIDLEKLCVKKGEQVWMIFVDIYTINADGNIFDAGVLGAFAALATAKIPVLKDGVVDREAAAKKSLPLDGKVVSTTFAKLGDKIVVDPIRKEELSMEARLTIGVKDGNIVSLQKGGEGGFNKKELEEMFERSLKHSKALLKTLG